MILNDFVYRICNSIFIALIWRSKALKSHFFRIFHALVIIDFRFDLFGYYKARKNILRKIWLQDYLETLLNLEYWLVVRLRTTGKYSISLQIATLETIFFIFGNYVNSKINKNHWIALWCIYTPQRTKLI